MTALTLESACASTTSWASTPSAAASRSRAPRSGWRSCAAAWRRPSRGGSSGAARHAGARSRSSCRSSTSRCCSAASTRPGVGVVDSLRVGHDHARAGAVESGALQVFANTEVLGHRRRARPRSSASAPRAATIEAESVVIACGVWSPQLARMAGASIPLTPAVHQMIDIGPVPRFAGVDEGDRVPDRPRHGHEHVRAPGRQRPRDRLVRAPRRSCTTPRRSRRSRRRRSRRPSSRSRRTTSTPQMEHALELMPEIVGDESVGVKYAINGLLVADARRDAAARRDARGARASGRRPRCGSRRARASASRWPSGWCTASRRSTCTSSDIAPLPRPPEDARARARRAPSEGFNKTYGIVHPAEQWASNRGVRLLARSRARAGARRRLLRGGRLGAAAVVRVERAAASSEYGDRITRREAEWDARWWSPIINAEHLAMRERAGDVRPLGVLHLRRLGPGALDVRAAASRCGRWTCRSAGSSTRRCCSPSGGFKSDLTIMRLGDEQFRVVTGGAHGMADLKWFADHLPAGRLGARSST